MNVQQFVFFFSTTTRLQQYDDNRDYPRVFVMTTDDVSHRLAG